ncbi:TVP38/TMEM64 family protein [Phenylobacterium parvum]|uniref:TVP38/TMEM64 family membrane protein n=2 Tax=Phenylobacterium parvum TaxID=2201350 RepID=A0A2Z3HUM1_9CAUL|nr:TVP38/TMEM64 family protein [Phenylobacterium parvum]
MVANMDGRAWVSLGVSFLLFGGVGLVFVFGARLLGFDSEAALEGWFGAAHGPWALPAAVAAFAALAFLGAPQFVLIAAAVVAFGPLAGSVYSWVGTMVSALIGFAVGRVAGARTLRIFSGEGLDRFMALIGRNGFLASLLVRLVPSAPFIVVNMAAGVTPMRTLDFAGGTALGIIPKIALTAFAGGAAFRALTGGGIGHVALLVLAGATWIGMGLLAREWVRRVTSSTPEA